jgi:hypothetical protein
MSEEQLLKWFRDLQRGIIKKTIIAIVSGLFLMIVGGGWTMAKVFNVKGKADKEYVDRFYGEIMRISETRNIILEQMLKAEKDANELKYSALIKQLDELDRQFKEHMRYHMEKTRGLSGSLSYFGYEIK